MNDRTPLRALLALVCAILTVSLIAGCGTRTAAPGKPRIALVMKSLANEFFSTMENGARAHQRAHAADYELLPNGIKDELDVAAQVAIVEQMIAQRVDAIVIAPADSKALVAVCAKAREAGITVVNIDNKLDEAVLAERKLAIPFVGPDNRKGAKMAGEYLVNRLDPGSEVAIVEGVPSAFNAISRRQGFEDAAKARGVTVVASQSAGWETAKANEVVSAIVREHPNLKGVLCANDSMALGAVAALRSAGKESQVLVAGFDNITAVQDLIRDGRVLVTVDQHGDQLAVFGIEYALEILKTKQAPADRETAVDVVTAERLEKR